MCLPHPITDHTNIALPPPSHTHTHTQMGPGGIQEVRSFDTADGLYDCVWSEEAENILVSASGDGSIKVRAAAQWPRLAECPSWVCLVCVWEGEGGGGGSGGLVWEAAGCTCIRAHWPRPERFEAKQQGGDRSRRVERALDFQLRAARVQGLASAVGWVACGRALRMWQRVGWLSAGRVPQLGSWRRSLCGCSPCGSLTPPPFLFRFGTWQRRQPLTLYAALRSTRMR
jgi:hypothetical protein